MPSVGTTPRLGFIATTPLKATGARSDPDVSVPMLAMQSPAATPTAEPLLDPPGENCAPKGFIA